MPAIAVTLAIAGMLVTALTAVTQQLQDASKRRNSQSASYIMEGTYTNNNSVPVCHKSKDASNSRTTKQQQGISVMPLTSWMQETARKQ